MAEQKRLVAAINDLDQLVKKSPWNYPPEPKNSVESLKARKEGNSLYVHDQHDVKIHLAILKHYNKSVAFAPVDSEELGLAYANRSALLAHFNKYVEAIDDLDRAMNLAVTDVQLVKLLCRKVEYQAELGIQEAEFTCEDAKIFLEGIEIGDDLKKSLIVKIVKAIVKLKKGEYPVPEDKPRVDLANIDRFQRSGECPSASSALSIGHTPQEYKFGRHLTATRDISPGEVLFADEPYVGCPIDIYLNCSHCLRFCWAPLPCATCAHAVYCNERCRSAARQLYHDVECRVLEWIWKGEERMNAARTMSVRMVVMAVRQAGGLNELMESFREVDASADYRCRGMLGAHFGNNYLSAYSLRTNSTRRSHPEQLSISKDSAVLLHLLAKHTPFFRKYFDADKKALLRSRDALLVAKLLAHYQHSILLNAVTVKDLYQVSSTGCNWTPLSETNSSGLYLTPYLSLLNHSCFPNVKRCEMNDRRTVLYAIRPISQGEQVFCSYGPTFANAPKNQRRDLLLSSFHFECKCVACENDWPMLTNLLRNLISFNTLELVEIDATNRAQHKCDMVIESLQKRSSTGDLNFDLDVIADFCHAIYMTERFCAQPNWRIASLTASLATIFNCIYGHIVAVPERC